MLNFELPGLACRGMCHSIGEIARALRAPLREATAGAGALPATSATLEEDASATGLASFCKWVIESEIHEVEARHTCM